MLVYNGQLTHSSQTSPEQIVRGLFWTVLYGITDPCQGILQVPLHGLVPGLLPHQLPSLLLLLHKPTCLRTSGIQLQGRLQAVVAEQHLQEVMSNYNLNWAGLRWEGFDLMTFRI